MRGVSMQITELVEIEPHEERVIVQDQGSEYPDN